MRGFVCVNQLFRKYAAQENGIKNEYIKVMHNICIMLPCCLLYLHTACHVNIENVAGMQKKLQWKSVTDSRVLLLIFHPLKQLISDITRDGEEHSSGKKKNCINVPTKIWEI